MDTSNVEFKRGFQLSWLSWNNGETMCSVGRGGCVKIYVSMENGQMDGVPWAVVEYEDGRIVKHNMACVESCEVALKGGEK